MVHVLQKTHNLTLLLDKDRTVHFVFVVVVVVVFFWGGDGEAGGIQKINL